jgi:hypothetical protein
MRSIILKSAVAAVLASVPLSVSYASDPAPYMADRPTAHSPSELAAMHSSAPSSTPSRSFALTNPLTGGLTSGSGRLATIEQELGQAMQQVNADRRGGALTPREVRFLRREGATVRTEAVGVARQNGGRIPAASYAMLQDRVSDLNRTIRSYETGAKRG